MVIWDITCVCLPYGLSIYLAKLKLCLNLMPRFIGDRFLKLNFNVASFRKVETSVQSNLTDIGQVRLN